MLATRITVGVVLLLSLCGGLSTFFLFLALTVAVAVVQALMTGAARWAFIGSRSRVWLPAVAAMAALLAGGALVPEGSKAEAVEKPEPAVTTTRTQPPVTSTVTETAAAEPLPAETVLVPAPAPVTVTETAAAGQPGVSPPPTSRTSSATPTGGRVYYENCTAVRSAGAAPIRPSDPG